MMHFKMTKALSLIKKVLQILLLGTLGICICVQVGILVLCYPLLIIWLGLLLLLAIGGIVSLMGGVAIAFFCWVIVFLYLMYSTRKIPFKKKKIIKNILIFVGLLLILYGSLYLLMYAVEAYIERLDIETWGS